MALGTRKQRVHQETLWIAQQELPASAAHPFYTRLNELLEGEKFDEFADATCQQFYARKMGRPRLTPAISFRSLLVSYFEGIDSERGIAWRASDSLVIRHFPGTGLDERSPDQSALSRTRRLIEVETQEQVFGFVLRVIAARGLLKGKTTGVDAPTLEANAAMRSIVRPGHWRQLPGVSDRISPQVLRKESGFETPTRAQLSQLDRKRKKRTSNEDWEHPHDPDARIAKRKDGSTHRAHKAEHEVDLETGDTTTMMETVAEAGDWIAKTAAAVNNEADGERVSAEGPQEVVAVKGYPSNAVQRKLSENGLRSYIPEPAYSVSVRSRPSSDSSPISAS
jgi:transposase